MAGQVRYGLPGMRIFVYRVESDGAFLHQAPKYINRDRFWGPDNQGTKPSEKNKRNQGEFLLEKMRKDQGPEKLVLTSR